MKMNSFMKKFAFLSHFFELSGDDQTTIEQQLKAFYPQELLTISQFIRDKDFDTTFFLWIGYTFGQEAKKSSKLFKKTLDSLNASSQNNCPKMDEVPRLVPHPQADTFPQQIPAQTMTRKSYDPTTIHVAQSANTTAKKRIQEKQTGDASNQHVTYPTRIYLDKAHDDFESDSRKDTIHNVTPMTKKKNKKEKK